MIKSQDRQEENKSLYGRVGPSSTSSRGKVTFKQPLRF